MNKSLGWIIKGAIAIVLAIVMLFVWSAMDLLFALSAHYVVKNPDAELITALENELECKLPGDLTIEQFDIAADYKSWADDERISYNIYSNYNEDKWKALIPDNNEAEEDRIYSFTSTTSMISNKATYKMKISVVKGATIIDDLVLEKGISTRESRKSARVISAVVCGMIALIPLFPFGKVRESARLRRWKKEHPEENSNL